MGKSTNITGLFLDIGGVLLTNSWDHDIRRRAAARFGLDYDELNERHQMTFDTYERGLITLDEYLRRVVFSRKRDFTIEQFRDFMFSQSRSLDENVQAFKRIADTNGLRVGAINNEGRELNIYRIQRFGLADLIEFFVSSCFVRFRKPDTDIYRLALDIAQVAPEQAAHIDDRPMFMDVAGGMGIHGIVHEDMEGTCRALAGMGLRHTGREECTSQSAALGPPAIQSPNPPVFGPELGIVGVLPGLGMPPVDPPSVQQLPQPFQRDRADDLLLLQVLTHLLERPDGQADQFLGRR